MSSGVTGGVRPAVVVLSLAVERCAPSTILAAKDLVAAELADAVAASFELSISNRSLAASGVDEALRGRRRDGDGGVAIAVLSVARLASAAALASAFAVVGLLAAGGQRQRACRQQD